MSVSLSQRGAREERVRQSAASSSRRRRRSTRLAPGLPPLHDGALSLELLGRYAREYDANGEGVTWPAVTFIEFLRLEARARLMRVPEELQDHARAPKAGKRGRAAALPVVTAPGATSRAIPDPRRTG